MSTNTETIVYEDATVKLIRKNLVPPPPPPPIDKSCLPGFHWDDNMMKCVADIIPPSPSPPPPPPPVGTILDADGVPMMAIPKLNGRNWYLRPANLGTLPPMDSDNRINPSGDILLELEVQTASIQTLGSKKYLHTTATSANDRCSIHMNSHKRGDDDESMIKYSWNSGAATQHYMVYPDDVKAAEYTLIYRITGIMDTSEEVSWILMGGGHHQPGPTNNQASCHNNHFKYAGSKGMNAFSVEFDHGDYERTSVTPMTTYGNMEGKIFGVKVCTMPRNDNSGRDTITYINEDPIDLVTGLPKLTGWRKYTQWTQTNYKSPPAHPHIWGGAKDKVRCDHIKTMDFFYASRVEITEMPS